MAYTHLNTLWSLEDVLDEYVFCHEDKQIYNLRKRQKAKISIDVQGYCVLNLRSIQGKFKVVKYHKIVALALINNGPYELIEHLDDNPLNNDVSNLLFSNKHDNAMRMYANGKTNTTPSIFEFCLEDSTTEGQIYRGTIKEIVKESGIPNGTVYDHIYNPHDRPGSGHTKYVFRYIRELTVGNQRIIRGHVSSTL